MDLVVLLRELTWTDSSSITSRQATLDVIGTLALRASAQSSVVSAAVLDAFDGFGNGAATAHYHRELLRQWKGNCRQIGRLGCAASVVRVLVRYAFDLRPNNVVASYTYTKLVLCPVGCETLSSTRR